MDILKDGKKFTIRLISTDERSLEAGDGEPQYVTEFCYDIVAVEIDDTACNEAGRQIIGVINSCYLDGSGAFELNGSPNALVEEADNINADVFNIAYVLYADENGLDNLELAVFDTLYIANVEVNEGWRGHDVGLLAAEAVIRAHGPNANIALIPSGSDSRLTRYWRRLGLKKLPIKGSGHVLWHSASENRKRFTVQKSSKKARAARLAAQVKS